MIYGRLVLSAIFTLALVAGDYSYSYDAESPTAAPTGAPSGSAAPTRDETYVPTRVTEAPSYAPTTETYAPSTSPTGKRPRGGVANDAGSPLCSDGVAEITAKAVLPVLVTLFNKGWAALAVSLGMDPWEDVVETSFKIDKWYGCIEYCALKYDTWASSCPYCVICDKAYVKLNLVKLTGLSDFLLDPIDVDSMTVNTSDVSCPLPDDAECAFSASFPISGSLKQSVSAQPPANSIELLDPLEGAEMVLEELVQGNFSNTSLGNPSFGDASLGSESGYALQLKFKDTAYKFKCSSGLYSTTDNFVYYKSLTCSSATAKASGTLKACFSGCGPGATISNVTLDELEVKAVLDSDKDYICSGTGNFWSYVGELFLADFASTIYKAVNGPIQDAINDEFEKLITQYHLNRCQWAVPSSAPTAGPTSVPSYSPSPGPTSEPTYPCTELAAPVCAGPTETCYYDPTCLDSGGFGCNAGGYEACRFCGFGTLPDCPSPAPSPVPTTITTTST